MRLEKAGTFARLDRQREDALAGALATYILAPPPAWPTESIFTPKATGAA
jgi:hypothetical protein